MGYYCARDCSAVSHFTALADSAASILASDPDLPQHSLAGAISDLFRKPRSGVRYTFGTVDEPPDHFLAQGWGAGVIRYPDGVLIDVPIAESPANANNWVLMLHRIGWLRLSGAGLSAVCKAWKDNAELDITAWARRREIPPSARLHAAIPGISLESFYSILGSRESPMDVNLASALAIALLIQEPKQAPTQRTEKGPTVYAGQWWQSLEKPRIATAAFDEVGPTAVPAVGVVVAVGVEKEAVLNQMKPLRSARAVHQVFHDSNTYFVGRLGAANVVLCMSDKGYGGRHGAHAVVSDMISTWRVCAIIAPGIAFGHEAKSQSIGDVLVSHKIIAYENQRIGVAGIVDRGDEPLAGGVLLNRFSNVEGWSFLAPSGVPVERHVGPLLSGEKLVDNPEFKKSLFERHPTAIGGEMEGVGIAAAADRCKREWIIIKAICDWGDGTKESSHQEFAAAAAVSLVVHVLNQPGSLAALH
jgi:nucleoside phosphorylase